MSFDIPVHEAANIFPLDEANISDLAADIRKNGQLVSIEMLDGKLLDGRRRYLACKEAGVKPLVREVAGIDDPVAYVLSLNLHRRHLTPSQLSTIGARARDIYDRRAKENQKLSQGRGAKGPVNVPDLKGDARDMAGKAVGVSGSLIDRATKVISKGTPELVAAVDEGRMSVTSAAKLTEAPHEVQQKVAAEARVSGGRYRKPVVVEEPDDGPTGERRGVGVIRANEAINCLIRIPKNDALRKRGFQIVTDWIKANK